jgi:4-diphosphocytidyl-2-C-methyl-D-erythritol kinase
MPTTVRSHAKVNLGLGIGAPRSDGFHALATLYQTLELHDLVTVSARRAAATAITLTSNDLRVPTDEHNTAWKMVRLALDAMGTAAIVSIQIEKRLPVQGGLGAGSANAVAALAGLEAELSANRQGGVLLSPADRLALAAEVGSDVPLFLIGGTVLGLDHGQEVYPFPDLEPLWCLVAAPAVGISTPQAFADWDRLCLADGLTAEASAAKLHRLSRAYASAFAEAIPQAEPGTGSSGVLSAGEDLAGSARAALVRTGITSWIENDFERVVFSQQPILCEIKRRLAAPGTREAALHASLSGSGSALFGLYAARGDAEAAQARVEAGVKQIGVQCTLTRTLPRTAYWQGMLLEK